MELTATKDTKDTKATRIKIKKTLAHTAQGLCAYLKEEIGGDWSPLVYSTANSIEDMNTSFSYAARLNGLAVTVTKEGMFSGYFSDQSGNTFPSLEPIPDTELPEEAVCEIFRAFSGGLTSLKSELTKSLSVLDKRKFMHVYDAYLSKLRKNEYTTRYERKDRN